MKNASFTPKYRLIFHSPLLTLEIGAPKS